MKILEILQEIRARLRLHTWTFNDPLDLILEQLIQDCMLSGIKEVDLSNSFYLSITFNNGVDLRAWNCNQYYAWLNVGKIGRYSWQNGRPSARTMLKLRNMLMSHMSDTLYADVLTRKK